MTCRLFVDEVGNSDLKGAAGDDNVRYLSLTGVVMKIGAHDRRLQPAFNSLKAVHLGETGDNPVILHRREIVRREGCFSVLRDEAKRDAFNADLMRIITDQPYQVIIVTIDKKEHLERYKVWRYDPYHYCLACLVERYVQWLARNSLRGDVVVEARFKKLDKKLKDSFFTLWQNGTPHLHAEVFKACLMSKDIRLYNKAANVAGLQLADLLAHPSHRDYRRQRLGESRPEDFGTQIVDVLRRSKYARHP